MQCAVLASAPRSSADRVASCVRSIVLHDLRSATPLRKLILHKRSNRVCWNPMEAFNFVVANEMQCRCFCGTCCRFRGQCAHRCADISAAVLACVCAAAVAPVNGDNAWIHARALALKTQQMPLLMQQLPPFTPQMPPCMLATLLSVANISASVSPCDPL
eukprot:3290366-Rhodomonas_salina.2